MLPSGGYRMSKSTSTRSKAAAVEEPSTASPPLVPAPASNRMVTRDPLVLQSIADLVPTRVEASFELRLNVREKRIQRVLDVATEAGASATVTTSAAAPTATTSASSDASVRKISRRPLSSRSKSSRRSRSRRVSSYP